MQTLNLMKLKPSLGALYAMPSGQEMDGVSSTAPRTKRNAQPGLASI